MRCNEFYEFMIKREEIRLAKVDGKPWPWTDDPILRQFKFTNVRREYDRTSQEFWKIYAEHQDASREVALLNCAIARYFGTYEFLQAVGWQDDFNPELLIDTASARLRDRQRVFTGAYVITNQGISDAKERVVVNIFLTGLWQAASEIAAMVQQDHSWESVVRRMARVPGFGGTGFMAKEVTLDTMFFADFWSHKHPDDLNRSVPKDYDRWTPIGPGARRGLKRVELSPTITSLLQLRAAQFGRWPKKWGLLSPSEIQFQLCEFDKYERTRLGEGRPRSLYRNHP